MPELIVTNFNRNFTGVSATAAGVTRAHLARYDLRLAGQPLPGCPEPISRRAATRASRRPPPGQSVTIWHVRRNTEMRAALWARDVLRLPVRIVFTSAAIRRHSGFPRWLISRMDAVIATSDAAASFVPHVKAIVPHGVDTRLYAPAPERDVTWHASGYPGARGIATIGRIRPEKGTDRFVEAMLRLLPEYPDVTALVIGRAAKADQGYLDDLKAKTAASGLGDRLLFVGEIPAPDLPNILPGLTALVQLPRYEGYGMVPLEGMASGVPFVATDQGYYRSFSGQGQAGLIVPEDDSHAVARTLDALLSSPERHAAMARSARQVAETHFSVQAEADAIGSVYEALRAPG